MRTIWSRLAVAMAIGVALIGTGASARSSYPYHHGSTYLSHRYYTARDGHRVHSPVMSQHAPAGASAHCADGSWSFSESRRGTCSRHGGVASWL